VLERQYKQVPGVADDSGFGGTVMQYQVLLDPAKLYAYHVTVPTVMQQLSVNNRMPAADSTSKAAVRLRDAAWDWCATRRTSPISCVGSQNGVPTRIRDIGEVEIGNAPRLGEFGFNKG
jgi:cobalt-zinc-cadmium resistance protein CzcA